MANKVLLTGSQIRYLLTLKKLHCSCGIRTTDIARELSITKPSVHNMMNYFLELDYVSKEPHRQVYLTETGYQQAVTFETYYRSLARKLSLPERSDESFDRAICAFLAELSEDSLGMLAQGA